MATMLARSAIFMIWRIGDGEWSWTLSPKAKINLVVAGATKSAIAAVEAAGGKVEVTVIKNKEVVKKLPKKS